MASTGERLVPIEFASKKLTPAEVKWETREKELFAVRWALQHWVHFLIGESVRGVDGSCQFKVSGVSRDWQSGSMGFVSASLRFPYRLCEGREQPQVAKSRLLRALPTDVNEDGDD